MVVRGGQWPWLWLIGGGGCELWSVVMMGVADRFGGSGRFDSKDYLFWREGTYTWQLTIVNKVRIVRAESRLRCMP